MLLQLSNNSKAISSPLDPIQGAPKGAFYNLRTALIVIANPSGGHHSPRDMVFSKLIWRSS